MSSLYGREFSHFAFVCFVLLLALAPSHEESNVPRYTFKEYSYVALPKYETQFQEFQSACQQSPSCIQLEGVDNLNCVRACISPSCFIDIYQSDKLETGEIDVRLESFKGCFVQRGARRGH